MRHHDHATHETGNSDLNTKRFVTWCTHESNSAQVEFELYLDKVTASNDILAFWRENNKTYPRLATLASSVFCEPATTAGVERLFSVAGHILGIRRTRLSNENYESMLFAKVNFDVYNTQHVAGENRLKL